MDAALSLERHGPLGRFDAPVEAEYRRWFEQRVLPLAIAMVLASLTAWILAPFSILLSDARGVDRGWAFGVCWGINVPVLTIGTWWLLRNGGRALVTLGTLAIALTAADSLLVLGGATDATAFVFLAAGIFYGMLAPMVQLPFVQTLALAVPIFALSLVLWARQPDAAWDINQSLVIITMGISVLLMAPAMAWATERGLRGNFEDEKIIAHQRTLIRRYAPSSVVSRIELGDDTVDHPQRRKVTVFFSDVVGFTTMADRVDPEALAAIVNEYLGSLADLIEQHGGTLNEFAGDGVMAIFGAPDDLAPDDQVRAALAAAQDLQRLLPEWSKGWYQHGIVEDAKARIGINTGTVSVGTFGSTVRATYTGIGLQTNIAARVQAQAEPGGILLSNTSWHLVKDTVPCEPRGQVMVKGVHFPIELYAPLIGSAGS
ncbi:MAG: adenylate/guanylate cyclase domain-containing protein [Marmoricola sp.]